MKLLSMTKTNSVDTAIFGLAVLLFMVAPTNGCFLGSCRQNANVEQQQAVETPPEPNHEGMYCQKLYEHTISEDQVIHGKQYYGFLLADSSTSAGGDAETTTEAPAMSGRIGTYTLPVYDNIDLNGLPVARLRGNMITSRDGADFLATATFEFFDGDNNDTNVTPSRSSRGSETAGELSTLLGVHASFSYRPGEEEDGFVYGYTTGGTGRFVPTSYNANVKSVVVATEPNFIVEWTFCSADPTNLLA